MYDDLHLPCCRSTCIHHIVLRNAKVVSDASSTHSTPVACAPRVRVLMVFYLLHWLLVSEVRGVVGRLLLASFLVSYLRKTGRGALGDREGDTSVSFLVPKRKDFMKAVAVSRRKPPAWRWAHRCYLLPTACGGQVRGQCARPTCAGLVQVTLFLRAVAANNASSVWQTNVREANAQRQVP
jgi:hypothetical protein